MFFKLYAKRHVQFGNNFGGMRNCKRLPESEQDKLKMVYFDELDITMHQIKLVFANGMGWGLRESSENSMLEVKHIEFVILEEGHEFAGSKIPQRKGVLLTPSISMVENKSSRSREGKVTQWKGKEREGGLPTTQRRWYGQRRQENRRTVTGQSHHAEKRMVEQGLTWR